MRLFPVSVLFFVGCLGACSTNPLSKSRSARDWVNQSGWNLENFFVNNVDQVLRETAPSLLERAYFESVSPVLTLGGATLDSWTPDGFWVLNRADWGEWWMDVATLAWHHRILYPNTPWSLYIDTYRQALDNSSRTRTLVNRRPIQAITSSPDTTQIVSIQRRLPWPELLQRRRRGSLGPCRSIESALPFYRFDHPVPMECREIPGPGHRVSLTWRGSLSANPSQSFDVSTLLSSLAQIHRQQWTPADVQVVRALLNTNPGFVVDFEAWLESSFGLMRRAYQSSLPSP